MKKIIALIITLFSVLGINAQIKINDRSECYNDCQMGTFLINETMNGRVKDFPNLNIGLAEQVNEYGHKVGVQVAILTAQYLYDSKVIAFDSPRLIGSYTYKENGAVYTIPLIASDKLAK